MIWARKLSRAVQAAVPAWLAAVLAVCAFVPTPFEIDDWIPVAITLVLLIVQPQRIARFRSAWKGGKSHRAFDAAYPRRNLTHLRLRRLRSLAVTERSWQA